MTTMRAAVKRIPDQPGIEVINVNRPEPGPTDILIRVAAAGICGSDMPIYLGKAQWLHIPRIPGHEWAGTVVEVGETIKDFSPGDPVTAQVLVSCGKCPLCLEGRQNLCTRAQGIGFSRDGALAEYLVLPNGPHIHRIPQNVEMEEAAGAEPAAVALHALNRAKFRPGDLAVIVGPGPIGLYALQVALLRGARTVVVGTSGDDLRLRLAEQLGAEKTINTSNNNLQQIVNSISSGRGADVAVDASGHPKGVESAYRLVRPGGEVVQLGRMHGEATMAASVIDIITRKELTVHGAFAETWLAFEEVLKLIASGKMRSAPLVTHRFPLEQTEAGFEMMRRREAVKVIIKP